MSLNQKLDPSKIRVGVARLAADGYTVVGPWFDFLATATDLTERLQFIESQAVTGSSSEDEPIQGEINLQGLTLDVELEPEAHFPLLAAFMGAFDTAVVEAGLAFRHRLSPNRGTPYADCIALRWTLDGQRTVILRPVLLSELTKAWSGINSRITLRLVVNAERADRVAGGVSTAGAPPVVPYIQGAPTAAERKSADPVLFVSVIDPVPGPDYDLIIAAKIGAAAAYGAGQKMFEGEPRRLNYASGLRMGQKAAYLEALLGDASGLNIGDEWSFALNRPGWTRALPLRVATTAAEARVFRNGLSYKITQGSIVLSRPLEYNPGGGSAYADGAMSPSGPRPVRWNLTEIAADDETVNLIRESQQFSLALHCETDVLIPGSSTYYEIRDISRNCRATAGSSVNQVNGQTIQHTLVASAHDSQDPDYPDPLTIEVTNSIADPVAA